MLKLILGLLAFLAVGYGIFKAVQWFIAQANSVKVSILKACLVCIASLLIGGGLVFMFVSLF